MLHVEIWSDVACPWCYVGKRRFETALARFEHRDAVQVTWRAFQLDPTAPAARDGDYAALLARKYGRSADEAQAMLAHMTAVAAAEGLDYDFAALRPGNTFDAHRLVALGARHGLQDATKERLLRAYLCDGALVSDHATLRALAAEIGLPAEEVDDLLGSDRFAADVQADRRTAEAFGLRGVPCFVVDRARAATGAQDPEVLLDLLRHSWEHRTPPATVAGGEACGVDGC